MPTAIKAAREARNAPRPEVAPGAKIIPHLWFTKEAVEAANFYVSVFPDSHVDSVTPIPANTPSGPEGSVPVVEFTVAGQPFMAISAGPLDSFNHAISFIVNCADQAELDHYWNALSKGGTIEMCGWLKDRYGVSWQIVPTVLGEMMQDPDRNRARRVTEAMLKMQKLDVAVLEKAYASTGQNQESGDAGTAREPLSGKFVWFEHASTDPKKAQAFYGKLLGWKAEPWGDSGYEMILAGDTIDTMIGGYTEPRSKGEKAHWFSYVSVDDVDAAAKATAANGGRVIEAPMDLPGVGRAALVADPQGAELYLFRNDRGDPPDSPAHEPPALGRFFWNELHTSDPSAALSFYEKVVGYAHETMDMGPAGVYHTLNASGNGRGGVTGHLPRGVSPHWLPYVSVGNPDATVVLARELGATILVEPTDIPDVGRFGVLEDPTGAVLAVMKATPPKPTTERRGGAPKPALRPAKGPT